MKRSKLALSRETVRRLTGSDLSNVHGGVPASGPPPCTEYSVGAQPSCTSCQSICNTCGGTCGTCGSCDGCTLYTF